MDLEELIELIREAWPHRYSRGLVTHIHRNHLVLEDGTQIHLRVLVQNLRVEDYNMEVVRE